MVNIFDNIRRIGIFMIAAQTVIHFTAGKQYEKYMKIITGVIILLMFIGPFLSAPESFAQSWQTEIDLMEKQFGGSLSREMPYAANSVEQTALRQIEEEIKVRLNEAVPDEELWVTDVTIDLGKAEDTVDEGTGSDGRSWVFRRVTVTLQSDMDGKPAGAYDGGIIRIDDISVDLQSEESVESEGQNSRQNAKTREYRHIFAQTLGVDEDRVEVVYRGGR